MNQAELLKILSITMGSYGELEGMRIDYVKMIKASIPDFFDVPEMDVRPMDKFLGME